ncbi:Transposase [Pollutimonas bauzanensis]|uniref:Transposase n=1 Tax=Pollutimonas bauzanensis TaxID=658167 RepID=A0A1M5Q2R7_9BURK|nr:Transposase [Pollutimonas bauzanensis]
MKQSRFTDSQIMAILKQAEAGTPVPELCREHGMSSASFYKWRAKYGGMDTSMMTRMKELEYSARQSATIGRPFNAWGRRKKLISVFTCGLGHLPRLTVRPSDAAIFKIHPCPFQQPNLEHSGSKRKQQANAQCQQPMLQAFRVGSIQILVDAPQLFISDESRCAFLGIHRDMTARIRSVGTITPYLYHVQHFA